MGITLASLFLSLSLPNAEVIRERCMFVDSQEIEIDLKGFDEWRVLRCSNVGSKLSYSLVSPVENVGGDVCFYRHALLEVNPQGELSTIGNFIGNTSFAMSEMGSCPDIMSSSYVPVEKVHAGDEQQEIFRSIMKVIDDLSGSEENIDKALSHVGFITRIFSEEFESFNGALKKMRVTNSSNIDVEVIYGDYHSDDYLVVCRVEKEIWILRFSKNKIGMVVKDVSRGIE